MPLIDPPPPPTVGTPAQDFAESVAARLRSEHARREQFYTALMRDVWRDGPDPIAGWDGLTPEQRIEAIGPKAAALFEAAAVDAGQLIAADPTAAARLPQVPAGFVVTPNPDGTVIVTRETQD